MRAYGIESKTLEELQALFEKYLLDIPSTKIWLFGSRAKGQHKKILTLIYSYLQNQKKLKNVYLCFDRHFKIRMYPILLILFITQS